MCDDENTGTIASARAEMDLRTTEGQFGNEFDSSVPAQLRFTSRPRQDTERFHEALETRGYSPADTNPARKYEGHSPYYDGEVINTDQHARVSVLVFRNDVVRLYPHDDHIPTERELQGLLCALEVGFEADLEHDPIDREARN